MQTAKPDNMGQTCITNLIMELEDLKVDTWANFLLGVKASGQGILTEREGSVRLTSLLRQIVL